MREVRITIDDSTGPPIPRDEEGNEYTHADMNFDSVFEAIDQELSLKGLDLLLGDCGSSDFFFCIVKR